MRISNKTYDIIKWIALAFCPALEVLILTIGKIWSPMIPYYAEAGATIAAIGVFLAAVIGVSSHTYYSDLAEPIDGDIEIYPITELDNEEEEI